MRLRPILLSALAILLAAGWTLAARGAAPDRTLIPDREWTDEVKAWMGRAMVSEAGWDGTRDQIAIAYVLLRRWRLMRHRVRRFSMVSVIRKYCAGFRDVAFTQRQKWVKNMRIDGKRPEGWPDDIHWRDYRDRWMTVLELAEAWRRGEHPDPCDGRAMYWGGPMDRPSKRMIKMNCGETKNWFYTVKFMQETSEATDGGAVANTLE